MAVMRAAPPVTAADPIKVTLSKNWTTPVVEVEALPVVTMALMAMGSPMLGAVGLIVRVIADVGRTGGAGSGGGPENAHTAPIPPFSGPPTSAVVPSPESATEAPWRGVQKLKPWQPGATLPAPTSLSPT